MPEKKSRSLLISFILGMLYVWYMIVYTISSYGSSTSGAEEIGVTIAIMIILPHLICVIVAVVCNAIGVFARKRGFALAGAILYAVSMVLMPIYFLFVLPSMILSFVGYARMRTSSATQPSTQPSTNVGVLRTSKVCRNCGTRVPTHNETCPNCGVYMHTQRHIATNTQPIQREVIPSSSPVPEVAQQKTKPGMGLTGVFHVARNMLAIVALVFIVVFAIGIMWPSGEANDTPRQDDNSIVDKNEVPEKEPEPVVLVDFSKMSELEVERWCKENNITHVAKYSYSSTVANGDVIKQSPKAEQEVMTYSSVSVTYSKGIEVTAEFKAALASAESYSGIFSMSKQAIYDQLVSEYGEKFPKAAAQYAVDNLTVDYNQNALESAKGYRELMSMSNAAIYDQLISEYGDKFTPAQAQYAIDNLDK